MDFIVENEKELLKLAEERSRVDMANIERLKKEADEVKIKYEEKLRLKES